MASRAPSPGRAEVRATRRRRDVEAAVRRRGSAAFAREVTPPAMPCGAGFAYDGGER